MPRKFAPDKEFLATFRVDDGDLQFQQLNVWSSDPDLTSELAQKRLVYKRGWSDEDLSRLVIQEIIRL